MATENSNLATPVELVGNAEDVQTVTVVDAQAEHASVESVDDAVCRGGCCAGRREGGLGS